MNARRALWLLYAAFIIYGGTIPFHFVGSHEAVRAKLHALPLNPFVSPDTGRRLSVPDSVQNILLFMPFGALGMAPLGNRRVLRLFAVTILGFLLSTTVEALQLLTADRVSSVADILTNTIGTVFGAVAVWTLSDLLRAARVRLHHEGLVVAELRPLAIAAAVIAVAYWQPFDVTLDVSSVAGKVHEFQHDPLQFTGLRDEGTSLMLSVFLATTLASYLSVLGERRPAVTAAALGSVFVCALESSQILITSRMPALWDAGVGVVGVLLGVFIWSASTLIVWPRLWLAVVVATTAASAALQMLSPFTLTTTYHSMGWFPFWGYYSHTTFESLSHVFELVLLYVPLGFFVGRSGLKNWQAVALAVFLALIVAGPVEYLQGWVVGRYPDITDIGISLAGAWLGAAAAVSRV